MKFKRIEWSRYSRHTNDPAFNGRGDYELIMVNIFSYQHWKPKARPRHQLMRLVICRLPI